MIISLCQGVLNFEISAKPLRPLLCISLCIRAGCFALLLFAFLNVPNFRTFAVHLFLGSVTSQVLSGALVTWHSLGLLIILDYHDHTQLQMLSNCSILCG